MTEPANPLDNKEAIAQTNRAMNFLVTNLVQPALRQSATNAQAIAETNRGIFALRDSLEAQREASDDTADETVELERRANYSEAAIEALRQEAIADRKAFKKELATEREESARRFDAQMAEIRALGEQNRALLSALANTNGRIDNLERAS